LYPLATFGAAFGLTRIYTRRESVFLRFFLVSFTTVSAWWIGMRKERKEENKFMLRNFKYFSKDVQRALQSGDSRYLRHILHQHNIIEDPKKALAQ
jgi:hypothetical protein